MLRNAPPNVTSRRRPAVLAGDVRRVALAIAALALSVEMRCAQAQAEQSYTVSGKDSFTIGAGDIRSEVAYEGTQTLTVSRHGKATRYAARVDYRRTDQGATSDANGSYIADVLPSGDQLDSADDDPDYLTVLNQPFSVALDKATLKDLRHLRAPLPFDFPSPFTSAPLRGFLQHIPDGRVGPHPVTGVKFTAGGPMHGGVPDRPGLTLIGTIEMHGSAYYDVESALLLALDATVTISGNLSNRSGKDPVRIVYRRSIRAQEPKAEPTALKR